MEIKLAGYPDNLSAQQVTIQNGAAVSEMIATQGRALIGIFTDAFGWTDAAIGYKSCFSGNPNDLKTVYDSGGNYLQTKVSTDAAADQIFIAFPQSDVVFAPFLQLTSRAAGTDNATNQAAARTLTLLFRNYLN
jgi:hypothetical protein